MITGAPERWDEVADVVVVGTGCAALTAAILAADGGADVVVVEKNDLIGGTTAVSGGVMWLPGNHHMADRGTPDSRDDALTYIRRVADGREPDPSLVEVFVDTAPEMLRYLNEKTPLTTQIVENFPDYYAMNGLEGSVWSGRSVEPAPFAMRDEIPDWVDRIATRSTLLSLGASTTLTEDLAGMGGAIANLDERAKREREGIRVKGAALVGSLVNGLVDRGVTIHTSTAADQLVVDGGEVIGLSCRRGDDGYVIGARKGVILACGGFEWNNEMVRGFIGYEIEPLSPGSNTGDGHRMAMEAGASMANMSSYWGQGASFDPSVTDEGRVVPQMMGAGFPASLMVNGGGHRFMNEGATYNDFPKPFGVFDTNHPGFPNKPPAFLIFDSVMKTSSPILSVGPADPAPDWFAQAASIRELADEIGVDPEVLEATVDEFNANAVAGGDPAFHRMNVQPIESGPYYALEVFPATLGTNGGCRIDADGRVLAYGGDVIPGLYAAGNTSSGVFGWAYVGGGTPLGLGATFGYLAGRHAAARPARSLESGVSR
jgi:succinate dehydrogenase/fumarate reductase flavoprotein subunit